MKNKDEDIEEMLLGSASLDDLIRMKIESEFQDEMKKAQENFEAAQTKYFSLTDFDAVCEAAAEKGIIKQSSIDALKKFRDDPSDESWIGNT